METIKKYRVKLRQESLLEYEPEIEQVDGNEYVFVFGWLMGEKEVFPGENTWLPRDKAYPLDAPMWIAEGDLVPV